MSSNSSNCAAGYCCLFGRHINVKVTGQGRSKCRYVMIGRGVGDDFLDDCGYNTNDYTQINSDNYYTYFYPKYSPLGLYTDTYGTLVIIKGTGCRLRVYRSSSEHVTHTESNLSTAVCNKIKKKIDDEMVKLKDYWSKWGVNFKRNMKHLPPLYNIVDPLENQPPAISLYGQPEDAVSSSGVDSSDLTPSLPLQPLTPSLPTQPLAQSLPTQPSTSSQLTQSTTPSTDEGPTILGVNAIPCRNVRTVNNPMYNMISNKNENGFECTYEKCVEGNGVNDCFKMPCSDKPPSSFSLRGLILFGHPKLHPFSFFSDEPATLYLFERGWCSKKTYSTSNMVTTSRAELLSAEDCVKVKKKLERSLKRQGVIIMPSGGISFGQTSADDSSDEVVSSPPTVVSAGTGPGYLPSQPKAPSTNNDAENQDIGSKSIKVSTSFPTTSNGQCQVEISVVGKGVKDTFKEPCTDKPADSVSTDNVFVFGDPKINSLCLYSDGSNVLYVIKNKICTKKTYTTKDGETTGIRIPLRLANCNTIKRTISNLLASQKTIPSISTAPSSSQPVTKPLISSALSSSQQVSPVATPAISAIPADLEKFKPAYPFKLGNNGVNSGYALKVNMYTDSFNVPGCNLYLTAKGKGINDHFQVPCSNERNKAISTGDFMFFGTPTSTLGLFSETPSTLFILTKGTCYKKTYGVTPSGPTLMGGAECEEVKKRMEERMDTNGKVINGGMMISRPTGSSSINNDNTKFFGYSKPLFEHPLFDPTPVEVPFDTTGVFDPPEIQVPTILSPQPIVPSEEPKLPVTSSTDLGVSWRDGIYNRIYSSSFRVDIKKTGDGPCSVEIVGRGVNELIKDSCSVLGDNIKKYDKSSYVLAVADPTKQSGLYTEDWGVLVFVREGRCFKKDYETEYGEHTKILTGEMSSTRCDKVKDSMSSTMGVNFGQSPGSSSDNGPTWRPGNYNRVYNGNPTININKNNNGPKNCIIAITIMGRALNDEIKGSCSVMGTNIMKKVNSYSLAVADPSTRSGLYTEDWGSLVVIRNGQCTLRKYDSSPINHTTKITSSDVDKFTCDRVKRKISGMLGANFG